MYDLPYLLSSKMERFGDLLWITKSSLSANMRFGTHVVVVGIGNIKKLLRGEFVSKDMLRQQFKEKETE